MKKTKKDLWITVRVDYKTKKALEMKAKKDGRTLSGYLTRLYLKVIGK